MRVIEHAFENIDGQNLYSCHWIPDQPVRANLVLLHGYAEHCGRYQHVAARLTAAGISIFAFDQPGHGRSQGRRGDIRSFDTYVDSVKRFIDAISKSRKQVPLFLLGHSMGGAVALMFVIQSTGGRTFRHSGRVRGLLLSGPMIKLPDTVPPLLQKASGVLARLFPLLPVQPLDARLISRDPEQVRLYDSDPLVYRGRVRARMGYCLLQATSYLHTRLDKIDVPLWIGHGTADRLVDPQGAQWLYDRAASTDKTLRLYPGLYHEILNEPEKDSILNEIADWILKRCS